MRDYPVLRSMADLRKWPESLPKKAIGPTSVHVFASCPMARTQKMCDGLLLARVREADGLYITSASLLCGPTVVNPQGTVMAIAHRNAMHAVESRFT
ncbi:hypothetical protein F2981_19000 (plasmid) [Sinorhizobium meliloti]|nr:hypothetical protein [Sinorhizobium meliloti]